MNRLRASSYRPDVAELLGVHYTETELCSSDDNEFIPTACVKHGERIVFPDDTKRFVYNFRVPFGTYGTYGRISTFTDRICSELNYYVKVFNKAWQLKFIGTTDTVIHLNDSTKEFTLLMTLAVRKSQLFKINPVTWHPSQFSLIINNQFIDNPEYFKLYRNLNKTYIPNMKQHFDVIYTNNINGLMLNPIKLSLPKFDSMTGIVNHLKSVNRSVVQAVNRR